jgi:hypothetical protein
MDLGSSWTYLPWVGVALFVIVRQFLPRPISEKTLVVMPVIAGLIGLQWVFKTPPDGPTAVSLITVNLALGVALGLARGATLKVWQTSAGTWMSRGGGVTLVLWLLAVGARIALAVSFPGAVPLIELPLFLAVTFAAQNLILWLRTQGEHGSAEQAG